MLEKMQRYLSYDTGTFSTISMMLADFRYKIDYNTTRVFPPTYSINVSTI